MVYSNRFDKNSDLSMTYLGQKKCLEKLESKWKRNFPIRGHGFTLGRLLDGTEWQILLDTGASNHTCQNHTI